MIRFPRRAFFRVAMPALMWATAGAAQEATATLRSADLWFDAKASLGPFRGSTHAAHGQMHSEMRGGTEVLPTTRGFVEMASTSLSTDNSIRDHDMRKTLNVDKFPTIRFDLDSVVVSAESTDSARVELLGRLTLHGVVRHIRFPAVVHRGPAQARVTAGFDLILPDYGITDLSRMLGALKMDKTIRVGLDVTFSMAREGLSLRRTTGHKAAG